jgi:hypothetical protein
MYPIVSVIGFYTSQNEVTLTGTKEDMTLLAHFFVFDAPSRHVLLYVPSETPEPYQGFLEEIYVLNSEDRINMERNESTLKITGSREQRQILAYGLLQFVEQISASVDFVEKHTQLQGYPDRSFPRLSSLNLIISVVGTAAEAVA